MTKKVITVVLLVIFILGTVAGAIGSYYFWQQLKEKSAKVDELQKKSDELQKKVNDLEEKEKTGVNTSKVTIRELSISGDWEDNSRKFELKKAYLTPVVADMPGSDPANLGKDWLVIEINVTDTRTNGKASVIEFDKYFRLQEDGKKLVPYKIIEFHLSPQENQTCYVYFPVNKNQTKFTLLFKELLNPKSIILDFNNKDVITKEGVFLIRQGFAPEYNK